MSILHKSGRRFVLPSAECAAERRARPPNNAGGDGKTGAAGAISRFGRDEGTESLSAHR